MTFLLVFRRYAPFAKFGLGFEGDHRVGASVSMQATARTWGIVPFERGSIGSMSGFSSGTQYVQWDWLRQVLGKHWSNVSSTETNKHISTNSISFTASTAGANPMLGGLAPDIDTFVDFRAHWHGSGVRFSGDIRGDDFPNAEVFVLDARTTGCLLFDGRTTGGQYTGPMTRLAGAHQRQILGHFLCSMLLSPAGVFLHPKNSCPVTTMQPYRAGPAWAGGSGQFSGAGASGRF